MAIREPEIFERRLDVPTEPIFRLTVEQYHEMARWGILSEDDAVELLDGWLVSKVTKNPPHTVVTLLVRDALARLLPVDWFVSSEQPITIDVSEPEPDIMVVRGRPQEYFERHPSPSDVALVVEVSDETLRRDQTIKRRIYARAGIAVYWIANLVEHKIEVYTQPGGQGAEADYQARGEYADDNRVPVTIAGAEIGQIAVRDLLP